jgi:hypothetical protein
MSDLSAPVCFPFALRIKTRANITQNLTQCHTRALGGGGGVPILPLAEAISRYPDYYIYPTQNPEQKPQIVKYLSGNGIDENRIRSFEEHGFEWRLDCDELDKTICEAFGRQTTCSGCSDLRFGYYRNRIKSAAVSRMCMTFSEIKNKNLVLFGNKRYCEAFELLLYETTVIRHIYGDIHEFKNLLDSSNDFLTVICSSKLEDIYLDTLENLGFLRNNDYVFAEDVVWKFLTEVETADLVDDINRAKLDLFRRVAESPPINQRYCNMARNGLYIMYDGIRGCCISSVILGSVGEVSYTDYINSFDFRLFHVSILNGTYIYCRKCDFLGTSSFFFSEPLALEQAKQKMTQPAELRLGYDQSCNLICRSCRTSRIMYQKMSAEQRCGLENVHENIVNNWLDHFDSVVVAINGDGFASKFYSDIVFNRFKGNKLMIQTNGLLLGRTVLKKLTELYKGRELRFFISIDAASPETYKALRGGNFNVLYENLLALGAAIRENNVSHLQINFIIQKQNFREMIDFVKLGKLINADLIYFQQLFPRAYDYEQFCQINVCDTNHPEHAELLEILKDPVFNDKAVLFEKPLVGA